MYQQPSLQGWQAGHLAPLNNLPASGSRSGSSHESENAPVRQVVNSQQPQQQQQQQQQLVAGMESWLQVKLCFEEK